MKLVEICDFLQSVKKNYVNYLVLGKQERGFFLLTQIGIQNWPSSSDFFVNVVDLSRNEIFLQLQMAFLGMHYCYYIRGIDELNEHEKNEWSLFLKNYQGPHKLVIVLSDDSFISGGCDRFVVPETVLLNDLLFVAGIIKKQVPKRLIMELTKILMPSQQDYSFSLAMTVILYARTTSFSMLKAFSDEYGTLIFSERASLFQLAEAFFVKEQYFFKTWQYLFGHYSIQFWISFWLEQTFRMVMFTFYKRNHMHELAKKISFRLPFSLINGRWKNLDLKKLQKLHSLLFQFDLNVKNGACEANIHTILNNAFFEIDY